MDEIVRSLRPLLRELAFREQEKIAAEVLRRRRARCQPLSGRVAGR